MCAWLVVWRKCKKIIRILIGIVLILAIVIYCFVRCNRKQYVSIRIACQEGSEPINPDKVLSSSGGGCEEFLMGTDDIYVSIPYDGIKRRYVLFAYSVYHRTGLDNVWIPYRWIQYSPSDHYFSSASSTYISPDGEVEGSVWWVDDIGEYVFSWETQNPDWEYRFVTLHVTVYDPNDNDKEK